MSANVQQLRHRPDVSRVPDVRPSLPVVRGADHPTGHIFCAARQCDVCPQDCKSCNLAGPWAQRIGNTGAGERAAGAGTGWPGKGFGIRGPGQDETPLSWAEVQTVLKAVLGGRL